MAVWVAGGGNSCTSKAPPIPNACACGLTDLSAASALLFSTAALNLACVSAFFLANFCASSLCAAVSASIAAREVACSSVVCCWASSASASVFSLAASFFSRAPGVLRGRRGR